MNAYLRGLRLERWPRSLAIALGSASLFFLHRDFFTAFLPGAIAARLLVAFLLTWTISTANYVVNEIVDAPFDAHHPVKRFRPLVQGEIKTVPFAVLGAALTAAGLGGAWILFSRAFFFSILALLAAGFIYNVKPVRTKDIPFLDAISESANNPIRFLIGWFAFAPPRLWPPVALLAGWWAFGNFLMTAKRLSEFRLLKEKAADYRLSHKRYSRNELLFGMTASALVTLASAVYGAIELRIRALLYFTPLLALYLSLFFRKTLEEKEIMEEPESLLRNPLIAISTVALVCLFALSFFL
jgi:decaprenyl-phosphate phosphoribosyltransferase